MARFRLRLEYVGTRYRGWQVQKNARTVQGALHEAVAAVSEFNERAYELFARPFVQATSNEASARALRDLHPLRASRWSWSDMNPMTWWLQGAAQAVRSSRQQAGESNSWTRAEQGYSDWLSASLDYYKDVRDALSEAAFFQSYGNLFALGTAEQHEAQRAAAQVDPRELPAVREALANLERGGVREAIVRMLLLGRSARTADHRVELDDIAETRRILRDAPEFQGLGADDMRRLLYEQSMVVEFGRDQALETLPGLLRSDEERRSALALVDKVAAVEDATDAQRALIARMRGSLRPHRAARPRAH